MTTVDEPALEKAEGKILFKVLSLMGDDRLMWDRRFLDQIQGARQKFSELLDKRYMAFRVHNNGKRSEELMLRFDPNAEEVIFVAPVTSG